MSETSLKSPSRRAFFRRFSPAEKIELPESAYPRPPWSRRNVDFLALCNRCGECVDRCPERVLRKSEETDPVLHGLPVLSLDYGRCTFCGECADHCRSGALSRTDGIKVQAVVHMTGNCQRTFNPACDMCADACARSAITVQAKSIEINAELCTGCGECSLDCHASALAIIKR